MMKRRLELDKSDEVQIQKSTITRMECYPDKIEIELGINNDFNDFNMIWIKSDGKQKKHDFTHKVIIELLHDWDVICEDWIDDNLNYEERNNMLTDTFIVSNKIDRKLGEDISIEFCKEIDLTKAPVVSIRFNENHSRKYELILNAPYIESNNNETTRYYSGPFKIYSTKVRLIMD